jgi:uracil-DNA glycosylase
MTLALPGSWGEGVWLPDGCLERIGEHLEAERAAGHEVLPGPGRFFRALECLEPARVQAVILGQDPYPTPGHAEGLSFSVAPGVRPFPGSLRNILREWSADLGFSIPREGSLLPWARAGVLMLNTVLSVRAGAAGSHRGKGWEQVTEAILRRVTSSRERVVFLLWGNDARRHAGWLSEGPHAVLESGHPSPLSARLFLGCRCFSKANRLLMEAGREPVDWRLEMGRETELALGLGSGDRG